MRRLTCLAVCLLSLGVAAPAQQSVATLLDRKLVSRLETIDKGISGVLGVAVVDLNTGAILEWNGNYIFPQASSIKIPIMAEVFRRFEAGELKRETAVTLNERDSVGGSGKLKDELRGGSVTLTLIELVVRMIRDSDNTATNRLIDMVGMDSVNRWIGGVGLKQTRLQRRMLDGQAAASDRENISSPLEMARLAELLYQGKIVSPKASEEMVGILKGVKADFRAAVPEKIAVASKPGDLDGVRVETGIVYLEGRPFALSVMGTFLDEGSNPIPAVTALVLEHFRKIASSNRYGNKLQ